MYLKTLQFHLTCGYVVSGKQGQCIRVRWEFPACGARLTSDFVRVTDKYRAFRAQPVLAAAYVLRHEGWERKESSCVDSKVSHHADPLPRAGG